MALAEISANLPTPVEPPSKVIQLVPPKMVEAEVEDMFAPKPKASEADLQANFARFRAERTRVKKLQKLTKKTQEQKRTTPEQMSLLRAKFVQQSKKYIGVPYHPRYHKDETSSEHYNAPLYLDCCGLTRRVLQDLAEEFGFVIGRGNQAYQYETCSIELTEDQMKPGDLIFTEGTYYQEGKKPCKHNIVHVEVYLGGGESGHQTIGARKQSGAIEILPHYKFTSKSYEITNYHLRSLDTWLSGVCKPTIDPAHWEKMWSQMELNAVSGGKSVFDAADEEDGEAGAKDDEYEAKARAGDSGVSENTVTPSVAKGLGVNGTNKVYFCGKGNNWKLVGAAIEKLGFSRLPFQYNFSNDFKFKWVEGRSEINFSQHSPGQLVNHIPNNQVITNKLNLLKTLEEHHLMTKSPTDDSTTTPSWFPKTYRLDAPSDILALLKACETKSDSTWIHKPASCNRGRGIGLVKGVENINKIVMKPSLNKSPTKGTPTKDNNSNSNENNENNNPDMPVGSARNVIQSRYSNFELSNGLIQSYITNPLLLYGKKFDVRVYCLIARTEPKSIVYFHEGYVRLSIENFTLAEDKLENNFIHLTNAAIQKKHPEYGARKEETIWSMKMLSNYIANEKSGEGESASGEAKEETRRNLNKKFEDICLEVYKASKGKLERKFGYFDLLGLDFMLDEDLNPFLLEVNTNPALSCECKEQTALIPRVVESAVNLVVGLHECEEGVVVGGDGVGCKVSSGDVEGVKGDFKLIFEEE